MYPESSVQRMPILTRLPVSLWPSASTEFRHGARVFLEFNGKSRVMVVQQYRPGIPPRRHCGFSISPPYFKVHHASATTEPTIHPAGSIALPAISYPCTVLTRQNGEALRPQETSTMLPRKQHSIINAHRSRSSKLDRTRISRTQRRIILYSPGS
jgi:hypothetical protein